MQNFVSIQPRTSPVKFAHLAEKSGKGSISNLSTKAATEQDRLREEYMASETAQPDELLQVVTELEELRQRNLQLLVHKASAQVQERALQVELKNIRVVRDACLAQGEKAASDISKAHESGSSLS